MSLLGKVLVKRPSPHINIVAANLAREFDAEAVELVEPEWNRFLDAISTVHS